MNGTPIHRGLYRDLHDQSEERLAQANRLYPVVKTYMDYCEFLECGLDAVAVATPVASHYSLAMQALKAGKHVLIEKPMAETSKQAETLIMEAKKHSLTLMVDHTFIYTSAVRKIHDLFKKNELGDIQYFESKNARVARGDLKYLPVRARARPSHRSRGREAARPNRPPEARSSMRLDEINRHINITLHSFIR